MSILVAAKHKASQGNLKGAFRNEAGAVDLASIMVGIVVIGLIGGVISATVFSVIPWTQDQAAMQQLDAVASAQNAYIGLAAEIHSEAVYFGTGQDLMDEQLFNARQANVAIGVSGTGEQATYVAVVESASGNAFWLEDASTTIGEAGSFSQALTDANAQLPASTDRYSAAALMPPLP